MLDLVLPIYNEAHLLERSVDELLAGAEAQDLPDWRVVIADNGSTDGTTELARRLASTRARVEAVTLSRKGRGFALRTVWNETDADHSLYMDVDLSTRLEAIWRVSRGLDAGADLVVGSRLDRRSEVVRGWKREVLSRGYNRLIRMLFRVESFDDAQCGFKGIRVETVRPLLPLIENNHWFFDTELLLLAETVGLETRSIPVTWVDDPDSTVDVAKTIREDLEGLARVYRTRRQKLEVWQRREAAVPA